MEAGRGRSSLQIFWKNTAFLKWLYGAILGYTWVILIALIEKLFGRGTRGIFVTFYIYFSPLTKSGVILAVMRVNSTLFLYFESQRKSAGSYYFSYESEAVMSGPAVREFIVTRQEDTVKFNDRTGRIVYLFVD